MIEREFQASVIELAQLLGWKVAHFRTARTKHGWTTAVSADGKGFPDLFMVKGARLVFAELKVGRNKPTPEQVEWLEVLKASGTEVYLWRDSDWDEILSILRKGPE